MEIHFGEFHMRRTSIAQDVVSNRSLFLPQTIFNVILRTFLEIEGVYVNLDIEQQ